MLHAKRRVLQTGSISTVHEVLFCDPLAKKRDPVRGRCLFSSRKTYIPRRSSAAGGVLARRLESRRPQRTGPEGPALKSSCPAFLHPVEHAPSHGPHTDHSEQGHIRNVDPAPGGCLRLNARDPVKRRQKVGATPPNPDLSSQKIEFMARPA